MILLEVTTQRKNVYITFAETAYGLRNTTEQEVTNILYMLSKRFPDIEGEWEFIPFSEFRLYGSEMSEMCNNIEEFVDEISNYFEFGESLPELMRHFSQHAKDSKTKAVADFHTSTAVDRLNNTQPTNPKTYN